MKLISLCLVFLFNLAWANSAQDDTMVVLPEGTYVPFFKEPKDKDVVVKSFRLDKFPVTNSQFNHFLINNQIFQKTKIITIYADKRYLQEWKDSLLSPEELKEIGNKPVTNVSWFVAKKYCQSLGKRLPTIAEWEYAADALNPNILKELLEWYSKTGDQPIGTIGKHSANKFGLHDMHGLIWEWVEDFSSVMISSDSRSKGDRTDGFFCGGGSVSSLDAKSYATFMRYGFRSGLKGDYNMRNLGFRCASNLKSEDKK